jgi:hypothetical protein
MYKNNIKNNIKNKCNDKGERGGALVFVIFGMVILASLSAAVVHTSFQRQSVARSMTEQDRAFEAALTGLDIAVFEIQANVNVVGDGIGNSEGALTGGKYSVTIAPEFGDSENYTLRALGEFGESKQALELIVSSENYFNYGMFGRSSLEMGGSYSIDSYDSEEGTYSSQSNGSYAGENGNLGSNSDIIANGGAVYGNATPGPSFQVLGDPSNVTGSTAPAIVPHEFETYIYEPPIASGGNYRGTRTLNSGVYRYNQLGLVGNHVLTLDGEVDLYVDGDFSVGGTASIVVAPGAVVNIYHGAGTVNIAGGGIINQDANPANLTIVSATSESIRVAGSAAFYGLLYAAESDFRSLGTSDWYGAVVADTISLTGTGMLHFDESLQVPAELSSFHVRSARPISTQGF